MKQPPPDSNVDLELSDRARAVGERVARLYEVMARLRAPGGCPWDRQQSLRTLRSYLLEETYELLEAIDGGEIEPHKEELGDLLFQAVFQARIREEEGRFDLGDVADGIADKLLHRHPHVFTNGARIDTPEEVRGVWEKLKQREKHGRSILGGVPDELPALLRAVRVGEKAAQVGFDWPDLEGVRAKVNEELDELDEALAEGDGQHAEEELGDLLFALAQYARHLKLMPEDALRGTIRRFKERFQGVERLAAERGQALTEMEMEQLEALWQQAKRELS